MSSAATTQGAQDNTAGAEHPKEDDIPTLGVLEEDDEFEEFPVAGTPHSPLRNALAFTRMWVDWDDSQTNLAQSGAAPGAAKSGGDKLWEDNWDDDDIEDDFSVQLRYAFVVLYGDSMGLTGRQERTREEERKRYIGCHAALNV